MPPKFTPRAPQVGRYWPGKPLKEDEESSSEEEDEDEDEEEEKPQVTPAAKVDQGSVGPGKLITTMKTTKLSEQGPYMEAEEESESESDSEEEEADEQDKRRLKIRQANRRATGDFVAVDRVDLEEEGEESDEESSEEESSEEDILPKRLLLRPTFKPKNQREQIQKDGNNIGLANYGNSEDAERERAREEKSKEVALKFVEHEMRTVAQAAEEAELNLERNRGIEAVDDTDDLDPAAERSAWKLRELQRIKREREALIARELELEELEKRRNMDESERLKEDYARKREIEQEREQNRGQMEFMQKWYHKGAYYQDEEILKRNFNVATAEEHRDKTTLPQSLQVRSGELGRASRTKWTHLSNEDTSKKDSPWFDAQNSANKRTLGKMGGMHDPNDRERKRRRS